MVQAIKEIDLLGFYLSKEALVVLGVVLLAAGLFVWLGGLRWRWLTAFLAAGLAGLIAAGFVNSETRMHAFVAALAVTAGFVMILKKNSLVFVAAALVLMLVIYLSVLPSLKKTGQWDMPGKGKIENDQRLSPSDSLKILSENVFYFSGRILSEVKNISIPGVVISLSLAAVTVTVGLFFCRTVSATAAAAIGTVYIFAGMCILLIQKGSMPLTGIYSNAIFYKTVAVCMVVFGTAVGVTLCPEKQIKQKPEDDKDGE